MPEIISSNTDVCETKTMNNWYWFAILLMLLAVAGCQAGGYSKHLPPPVVRRVQPLANPNSAPAQTTHPHIKIAKPSYSGNIPSAWIPPARLEIPGRWQAIVIHHSAEDFGDARSYNLAHKERGWDGLGYDFVIDNGNNKDGKPDGCVEVGYRWRQQLVGAHCRARPDDNNYWNKHSIGICLVGNFQKHPPTEAQWRSLVKLIHFLQRRYHIPTSKIVGHRDIKPTACPGKYFSFAELRRRLAR